MPGAGSLINSAALRDTPASIAMKTARIVIRRVPQIMRNAIRDLRFGGLLGGTKKTRYDHLGAHDVANSEYENLQALFASVAVSEADVIVDVGCGKGRSTNWFVSRYPRTTIIGIELDPAVCARTARRLRRRKNVTIICADATRVVPPDGTIFYLFNPFNEAMVRQFAATLAESRPSSLEASTIVVYYNCKFVSVFEDDPRFAVRTIDDPRLAAMSAIIDLA
jgi:SAM-dependent methyltransferase